VTRWKKGAVLSFSVLYTCIHPSRVRPIAWSIVRIVPAGSSLARPSTTSTATSSFPSLVYVTRRTNMGCCSLGTVK